MTKINTLWLPFFVVTGLIFLSSPAGAVQEEAKIFTTVTTGNQIIEKEDISGAREEAVAVALQESVERTLSEMMSSELFAANLEFLFDYILPDTSKYIVNYRVLTAFEKSSQFIVAVKADIDTAAIEKILKKYEIISSRGEKPSVLLFISEKNETDILPKYWWGNNPLPYSSFAATAVEAHLKENGYTVFPAGDEKIDPGMHDIKFNAIYDNQAAVALGEAVGADMVVMGKATCTRISDDMVPAERYKTLISLDILNVKTAEKIGAINITRTAGDKTAPDEGTADTVTTDETAADAVIPGEEVPDETAADAPPEDTAAVMETDEDGRKAALEAAGKRAGEKVAAGMDRF